MIGDPEGPSFIVRVVEYRRSYGAFVRRFQLLFGADL